MSSYNNRLRMGASLLLAAVLTGGCRTGTITGSPGDALAGDAASGDETSQHSDDDTLPGDSDLPAGDTGPVLGECENEIDDDGDGLADADDPGCLATGGESEATQCQDGLDNDNDGSTDFPDDEDCADIHDNAEGTSCHVVEVCTNGTDDNCDGTTDEAECITENHYLENWKNIGSVVDYVVFGDYPLYLETQENRNLQRQSWGSWCQGQTGSAEPLEETTYCLGSADDYLEWDMFVPERGTYVLMLADLHGSVTHHELRVDRGEGFESLPNILSDQSVALLMHNVGGYPRSIFYLVELEQGRQRFRVDNGQAFFFVRAAVLARLLRQDHFHADPLYPHLHFTQEEIDAIVASPTPAQQSIIDEVSSTAQGHMDITDLPALGQRNRDGVIESLGYSGLLTGNTAHLDKGVELFFQVLDWVAQNDGDYRGLDILTYGYDMRRFGVCFDLLHNAMTPGQRTQAKDALRIEMMRHALSNISGQWWRLPRRGGWTSSHGQGGQLGLALYFDDELAKFYVDVSVLMYKTSLRDNVTIDGVHLQALSAYYGWDFWNLVHFQNALLKNPGVQATNLFEYDDRALQKYYRWLTYSLAPTERCMGPFGTSNCINGFYANMGSTLLLSAEYYQDGVIKWLYDNTVGDDATAFVIGSPLTEALSWVGTQVEATDPSSSLPLGRALREHEHVYMRTGWQREDIAYMTRCGFAGNHDQAEHGSIILYADGLNYVQTYNGYDAGAATHGPSSKNYILIDGRGQARAGDMNTRMGTVPHFLHSDDVDYQLCDNSLAYNVDPSDSSSHPVEYSERRVVFVRPRAHAGGYFVIFDRIKANDSNTHDYDFVLHTGCDKQWWGVSDDSCENPLSLQADVDQGATISDWDATSNLNLKVRFVDPPADQMTFDVEPMPVASYPDYLRASRNASSLTGEFMTILYPEVPDSGRTLPSLTTLSLAAGQSGARLGNDTLIWSKDSSAINSEGIESDGRIVIVRRDASAPVFIAMLEGTDVAVDGVSYVATSASTNAVFSIQSNGIQLTVGNEMAASTVDVTIGGLDSSANYALSIDDGPSETRATSAGGEIEISSVGPAKRVISLVLQ